MKFCPKCGSIMVPVRKGNVVYLKCRKCGYEERLSKKEKASFVEKSVIEEEKHVKVPIVKSEATQSEEVDEDYRKQLLDNMLEMGDEFD